MRVFLLFFGISVFFSGFFLCAKEPDQNHDFQIWLYDSVSSKLNEKTRFFLEAEIRYGADASKLYLYYVQARLLYSLYKRLDFDIGYRQVFSFHQMEGWIPSYEPFAEVFLNLKLGAWDLIDRNRFEYRFFETLPNHWNYRNLVTLISPWKWGKMQLNPQLFDEVFFRKDRGFDQNRFGFGAAVTPSEKSTLTLYYMLRDLKRMEGWIHQKVLWLQLDFAF